MLYLVRHGQTDWNAEMRLQGQQDIPLNDFGRAQAAHNGQTLKTLIKDPKSFDFVASPLGRTRETMEILLTELGLKKSTYRIDQRVIEISFGDWEGSTFAELRVDHNDAVEERLANKWYFVQPNGESYQILCERVAPWLNDVKRDTVVVCHGGVIRALLRLLTNVSTAEIAEMTVPQDQIYAWDGTSGSWV